MALEAAKLDDVSRFFPGCLSSHEGAQEVSAQNGTPGDSLLDMGVIYVLRINPLTDHQTSELSNYLAIGIHTGRYINIAMPDQPSMLMLVTRTVSAGLRAATVMRRRLPFMQVFFTGTLRQAGSAAVRLVTNELSQRMAVETAAEDARRMQAQAVATEVALKAALQAEAQRHALEDGAVRIAQQAACIAALDAVNARIASMAHGMGGQQSMHPCQQAAELADLQAVAVMPSYGAMPAWGGAAYPPALDTGSGFNVGTSMAMHTAALNAALGNLTGPADNATSLLPLLQQQMHSAMRSAAPGPAMHMEPSSVLGFGARGPSPANAGMSSAGMAALAQQLRASAMASQPGLQGQGGLLHMLGGMPQKQRMQQAMSPPPMPEARPHGQPQRFHMPPYQHMPATTQPSMDFALAQQLGMLGNAHGDGQGIRASLGGVPPASSYNMPSESEPRSEHMQGDGGVPNPSMYATWLQGITEKDKVYDSAPNSGREADAAIPGAAINRRDVLDAVVLATRNLNINTEKPLASKSSSGTGQCVPAMLLPRRS